MPRFVDGPALLLISTMKANHQNHVRTQNLREGDQKIYEINIL